MKRLLDGVVLLVLFYVGLHLPRSFLLLYVLILMVFGRACMGRSGLRLVVRTLRSAVVLRPGLLLLLFSIAYGLGMVAWRFWALPADGLDFVNALLLPALLFLAGAQAASFPRIWSTRLLLAYALGGLVYLLIALMSAREPWWDWSQVFPASIAVPWGSSTQINVRSVEQNGYPALLLFAPGLSLISASATSRRLIGLCFAVLSLLGLHVVGALQGRLGFLALVCATAPVLALLVPGWLTALSRSWRVPWRVRAALSAFGLVLFAVVVAAAYSRLPASGVGIWAQGLCEERFSLFGSMLMRLGQAPWGGRLLQVPFTPCSGPGPLLLAAEGGDVLMAHNVFLDIYFSVGLVPVLLLLAAILPACWVVIRGFSTAWPVWDWQVCLRWGWICLLLCQWFFQPLLYSDGLLYYFSFFLLGLFLVEGVRAFSEVASVCLDSASPGIDSCK